MATATCLGDISTGASGELICSIAWTVAAPFDPATLDPVILAEAFASGFTIIGICWFIGKSFSMVLKAIRDL